MMHCNIGLKSYTLRSILNRDAFLYSQYTASGKSFDKLRKWFHFNSLLLIIR